MSERLARRSGCEAPARCTGRLGGCSGDTGRNRRLGDQGFGKWVSWQVEGDGDVWDAVVGLQGEARFNENWFLPWRLDVGAGESDLTWQAGIGIGYRFNRNDVVFGYRHMEWQLPDDMLLSRYYQSGPMLLWNIRF